MSDTITISAYSRSFAALVVTGFRSGRQDLISRLAIGTVYVGLLVILSGLYRITPFEDLGIDTPLNYASVVWYMTLTELIAMAVWIQYREVREEVIAHRISGLFVLPIGYVRLKAGEWLGRTLGSLVEFGALGAGVAFLLTGTVAVPLGDILPLMISLVLATIIFNNIHLMIGLTEIWGSHSRPVFLIVQKLLFLLGGLLIPISIYPGWLQTLAWATPFPSILFGPASFAFGLGSGAVFSLLCIQLFWAIASFCAATAVFQAARRNIGLHGD